MSFEFSRALTTSLLLAPLIGALVGCDDHQPTGNTSSQQENLRRNDRGEALINAAVGQLADLPSAVDTELRPPTIILDSTKSADGADVLAFGLANPAMPGNPINFISVPPPAQNSRFRSIGVKSGDILKYYIVEDETVTEEMRGFSRQLAKDLTVAQVIDNNTLLIEGTLPEQVFFPAKIEVWRYLDDRLLEISQKLSTYDERRLPPLGWEPSPEDHVLMQIVTWLNQWLRQSEPKTDWKRDPLLDSLDSALLTAEQLAPFLSLASLSAKDFNPYDELQPEGEKSMSDSLYDVRLLQEAVWLRDISRWAQHDNFNEIARATALFDWTIRNVQLVADENAAPHRPWKVLLFGRGTAEQRAWVFSLLCRQQGLDVVMLSVAPPAAPADGAEAAPGAPKFWVPALALDGQLYLFDTRLGLPIPGPGGQGVATLSQVRTDDSLLRHLDLEDSSYPMNSDGLKNVVAYVVADPFDLSKRARQLESKLTGDNHLVLSSAPSELASQLKSIPELSDVKLWPMPFETLRDQLTLGRAERYREALAFEPFAMRPVVWKARTRHFQGRLLIDAKSPDEGLDDHREAKKLYISKWVRPPDRQIARATLAEERRIKSIVKLNATYWVGLLSFDDSKLDVAADWLARPELTDTDSPWSSGARYNLARALEAQKKYDEAIKLLEKDESPQQHGNRLRARMLKARAE